MNFMNPFTDEHQMFRKTVSDFVAREIKPQAERWEEMGEIPREIFLKLGELGILGARYDEKYGGSGLDFWYTLILCEELAKSALGRDAHGYRAQMLDLLARAKLLTAVD